MSLLPPLCDAETRAARALYQLRTNNHLKKRLRNQAVAFLGEPFFQEVEGHWIRDTIQDTASLFSKYEPEDIHESRPSQIERLDQLHLLALALLLQEHTPWKAAEKCALGSLAHAASQAWIQQTRNPSKWAHMCTSARRDASKRRNAKNQYLRCFNERDFTIMLVVYLADEVSKRYPDARMRGR